MSGTSNYPPYEPNAKGFTEALIDFKDTLAGRTVYSVAGFEAPAFENVTQGDAVDYGDLNRSCHRTGAASNSHGGLG